MGPRKKIVLALFLGSAMAVKLNQRIDQSQALAIVEQEKMDLLADLEAE